MLEGDEYDTAFVDKRSKFLHYHTRTLILNNLEFDHADIFPDLDAIKRQFSHLLRTVPANGNIIANADEPNLADVLGQGCWTPVTLFAEQGHPSAEWQWQATSEDGTAFKLFRHGKLFVEVQWSMIGIHNVANACAVAATAFTLGIDANTIKSALKSFAGIRRRMSLTGTVNGIRIFDDFAHHPTAIKGIVSAAKAAMKSAGKLWVIVEPRSNTMRSRIHQDRLPNCFDAVDRLIFVPASDRNLPPHEVLDTKAICREIGSHAQVLPDVDTIIEHLAKQLNDGDDVLILSNGGFDGIHAKLINRLKRVTT
ncbi:MAG TPA: Mur ligase family protein [Mariprofundaceae bacterium]|nr:Mur ligase family protein [Mariprofundaceae bacterium]